MRRERLINRRRQGDLGEASAIEWLTRRGATVLVPFGHSPDYDLVADVEGRLLRVQVKTSTYLYVRSSGTRRWSVNICTNGGNQSWTGTVKVLDPARIDYLYVLVGDGRRWFIPSEHLQASRALRLGGPKYSEFEIEGTHPIANLVVGESGRVTRIAGSPGECPSGQRERAVNASALPTQVRILSPPSPPAYERRDARLGQAVIWGKRRITIPMHAFEDAGFEIGERLHVHAEAPGRVVLERIEVPDRLFE